MAEIRYKLTDFNVADGTLHVTVDDGGNPPPHTPSHPPGDTVFGELMMEMNEQSTVITHSSEDFSKAVQVSGFKQANSKGVVTDASIGNMEIVTAGWYLVLATLSVSGSQADVSAAIFHNDQKVLTRAARRLASRNDLASMTVQGMLMLKNGDKICVKIQNQTRADDLIVENCSFTAVKQ